MERNEVEADREFIQIFYEILSVLQIRRFLRLFLNTEMAFLNEIMRSDETLSERWQIYRVFRNRPIPERFINQLCRGSSVQ